MARLPRKRKPLPRGRLVGASAVVGIPPRLKPATVIAIAAGAGLGAVVGLLIAENPQGFMEACNVLGKSITIKGLDDVRAASTKPDLWVGKKAAVWFMAPDKTQHAFALALDGAPGTCACGAQTLGTLDVVHTFAKRQKRCPACVEILRKAEYVGAGSVWTTKDMPPIPMPIPTSDGAPTTAAPPKSRKTRRKAQRVPGDTQSDPH